MINNKKVCTYCKLNEPLPNVCEKCETVFNMLSDNYSILHRDMFETSNRVDPFNEYFVLGGRSAVIYNKEIVLL